MDPVDFLREHAPFNDLSTDGLALIAKSLEVTFTERGVRILARGGERSGYLYVLRKGAVRLELDGRLIDELGPGECFGFPSLLSRGEPQLDVVTDQDCLLYRLPEEPFHRLLASEVAFAGFFLGSLAERLRAATAGEPSSLGGGLGTPVGALARREPVWVEANATVGEAAQVMRRERVSSVLVGSPAGAGAGLDKNLGILTDRDLRRRVLAAGRGPEAPARPAATSPVVTCDADASLYEALLVMLRARIHHLPLVRDGAIVGVVTHTDLLRQQQKSPVFLLKRIERAERAEDLAGFPDEMTGMVEALLWGGLEATDIGRVVAALNDALAVSLLQRAEAELGPPPVPYRWIVFGSEGRQEQALITDQDNALIYAEETPAAAAYFGRLAERVVGGLIAASVPPCAGGFMATNWHQSLPAWVAQFRHWGAEPEPEALMKAANFFDFRPIHGALDLAPLEEAIAAAAGNRVFLAQFTKEGLGMRPPIGIFHRIRQHAEGIDLKAGGLIPVVSLARLYALEAGARAGSTLQRLRHAEAAGVLSREGSEMLAEAFRFVFRLRLRQQLAARRHGLPNANVRLEALGPLERRHLKEAFVAIRQMQEAAAQRYDVGLLG
jgi:CBS domain-containing protein